MTILMFLLGVIFGIIVSKLGKRKKISYDGDMVVSVDEEGHKVALLEFADSPYDIDEKPSITLKVVKKKIA